MHCFLPPTSLTHILHHFCWFINFLIVENFFKHHIWGISGLSIIILHTCHSCYHQLLVVRSQHSFKTRVDWLMSSTLVSKLGDIASRSAGSTTQVPVYSSKNKLAAQTSLLHLLLVSHQSHLPLLTAAAYRNTEYLVPGTKYQWYMNEDGV